MASNDTIIMYKVRILMHELHKGRRANKSQKSTVFKWGNGKPQCLTEPLLLSVTSVYLLHILVMNMFFFKTIYYI